jgi:hypothetical protein
MNRENVKSLFGVIGILVLASVLWFYINRELASVLVGLLFGRLINQVPFFEKKDSAQLAFRASELTTPLKNMYFQFSLGGNFYTGGLDVFRYQIENQGLLKLLKQNAPKLASELGRLAILLQEIKEQKYGEDEAVKLLGVEHLKAQRQLGEAYVKEEIFSIRVAGDDQVRKLVVNIKDEIQTIIAKLGG